MDIIVNVINQRLIVQSNHKTLVEGSNNFIRFVFNFSDDWNGMTKVALFGQDISTYAKPLDNENTVYLPSEIVRGDFALTVNGTLDEKVATTSVLYMHVDRQTPISKDMESMPETVYDRIVLKIYEYYTDMQNAYQEFTDGVIASETSAANSAARAETAADEADESASNASMSERNALFYRDEAENSATIAADSATAAAASLVQTNEAAQTAERYAESAEQSAHDAAAYAGTNLYNIALNPSTGRLALYYIGES